METAGVWELKLAIDELMQGKNLAKQLQTHLDPSSSPRLRESLVQNVLASFSRAILLLKSSNNSEREPHPTGSDIGMESPRSISGSARSENSNRGFKDQERRDMLKKRKMLPKWTEQVRICTGTAVDGPLDDGYSWRKYGQKDILGAKHPRGYYRCTHRNLKGCLATKQVQRSDEDPSMFEVSYRGNHTCHRSGVGRGQIPTSTVPPAVNQEQQQPQILSNFRSGGLRVKTEDLGNRDSAINSPSSFSFPSQSANNHFKPDDDIFSPSKQQQQQLDNNFMLCSFSPPFISPATSESDYFSMSPCQMNSCCGGPNLHTAESDPTEIVSAMTPASNSSMVDLDFRLESVEFDPNFPLEAFFP